MKPKALLWILASALLSLPLHASTFLALTPEELATQAESVVEGRVLSVRSFWNAPRSVIVTEARIAVTDRILGEAPGEVVVRTFGGTIGDVTIEAHGFPTFREGERQLLYLVTEPRDGSTRVLAYQQGQYRIRSESGVDVASSTLDGGASLVMGDGWPIEAPRSMRLGDLKDRIRGDARRAGRAAR